MVKVMLRRSLQQSAIPFVTRTLTFRSLSIPERQLSKTWRPKVIYGAKATADCCILELMKFRKVILHRWKNAGKSI
jgi:hypothetical protein